MSNTSVRICGPLQPICRQQNEGGLCSAPPPPNFCDNFSDYPLTLFFKSLLAAHLLTMRAKVCTLLPTGFQSAILFFILVQHLQTTVDSQ